MRLLLIEDDRKISDTLTELLRSRGFGVDLAYTKAEGWEKAFVEEYDLLILDWMLSDGNGVDLCRDLREENLTTPILMLTAKSMVDDIELGLDAGADDYLTKPFELRELMARIRALTRRKEAITPDFFRHRDLFIDFHKQLVLVEETEIPLSGKEFSILEYLIRNRDKIVTRDDLLLHVWDESSDPASNIVDVYISLLRKKIDPHHYCNLIKTIKGKGYTLCPE